MHAQNSGRFSLPRWFAGLIAGLAAFSLSLSATAAEKEAFIERIPPKEYAEVEALGPKAFSHDSEVVIFRTDKRRVAYVLTLQRKADGASEWSLALPPPKKDEPFPSLSADFDPKVERQFIAALNFKLSRWVTVVEKSHNPDFYDSAWWIYLRVENGAVTALIDAASFEKNADARAFKELFIDGPERLTLAEPAKRNEVLFDMDTRSTKIVREELAKQ